MTIGEALRQAGKRLQEAGIETGQAEAIALWGLIDSSAFVDRSANVDSEKLAKFQYFVDRRARREPFSHISGRRMFYKSSFRVTPDVLDPRPDTETLVELALSKPFNRVLDLGTGSGCILISLLIERPEATGVGTDISHKAVLVAGENAARLGMADRLVLPLSDWYDDIGGRFDLIVSNPPYIAAGEMEALQPEVRDYEPRAALTDEADGLTAYRRISSRALQHLKPGGRLLVEIGPTQGAAVSSLFREGGLENVEVHHDLDRRERVVSGVAPSV
ncbi:peptide chain release factor N(5)-glutamine methyltransferase [Silicimonas sp. MF1-12-2]|uniref:peptide chain release factor N(5)-glutamine methyltransferase n=1 Tax=Silicimonas sp. MF1-12-2 TaxID=3384793 RepID=UPI0039B6BF91